MSGTSVRLTKHFNRHGMRHFITRDRERARYLATRFSQFASTGSDGQNEPVTNNAVSYLATVGVGSPATQYHLIVDTGSSNTWVGANTRYHATSTSHSTGRSVTVSYGSGSFSGTEYTDTVTLSDELVIQNQSIGVASKATGFTGVDGILGVGPVDLTNGTVSGSTAIPTVVDNLQSQGTISSRVLGISFQPPTSLNEVNGELTYGGVDSTKFTSDVTYVPITSTSPASNYWGIDQTVSYGDQQILNSAGIVDTGTTLIYLATDAFNAYKSATGATEDSSTGLLKITEEQYNNLQSLNFVIGGTTFELIPNAQIWPRSLNSQLGGTDSDYYLVVTDMGSNSGQGLDFINGQSFLERFYSIYDSDNNQVGLATTPFTSAETN